MVDLGSVPSRLLHAALFGVALGGCSFAIDLGDLQDGTGAAGGASATTSSTASGSPTSGVGGSGGDADGGAGGQGGMPVTSMYEAEVLADSPISYFRFDDRASLMTAEDSIGNTMGVYTAGVIRGEPGAIVGDASASITLDGIGGAVVLPDVFGFEPNAPFTVEAWIRPVRMGSTQFIFEKSERTPRDGYTLLVYSDLVPGIERWAMGTATVSEGPVPIAKGAWHHVVTTFDGVTLRFFCDGVPGPTSTTAAPLIDGPDPAVIGAPSNLQGNFFGGGIDEVAIYDYPLAGTRVWAHYQAGSAN